MPVYVYKCPKCEYHKEYFHNMSEIDEPSEETLYQTSCPLNENCKESNDDMEQVRFERVPQAPQLLGMIEGSSIKGKQKTERIQKERKQRSRDHFRNEVYPELPAVDKLQFKKKWDQKNQQVNINKNSK